MWALLFLAVLAGVGAVALLQYRAARRSYRPLASRQPERPQERIPLGMEALDLDSVSAANRRNESLERGQTNWLRRTGFFGRTDAQIAPLADDETYAAQYHAAYQKDRSED